MNRIPIIIAAIAVSLILRRTLRHRNAASKDATAPSTTPRTRRFRFTLSAGIPLVAEREIRQRLRGRIFRVSTLIMLLAVGAAIVIPTIGGNGSSKGTVGVTGPLTTSERAAIIAAAEQVGSTVQIVQEPSSAAAIAAVQHGTLDLAVLNDAQVIVQHTLTSSDDSDDANAARTVAQLLADDQAFDAAGLTTSQRATISTIRPLPIHGLSRAKGGSSSDQGTATIGLILLFVLLSQYGTWTLIGVMEEKSSRVVEVLLAALRPTQLLAGKVVGIGALVFAQATLIVGFALGLGAAVGSNVLTGSAPTEVVTILFWLVLGYAFYSWVFAAAGSMVERQDQVQAIAFPITIPLLVGYVSSITAVNGDHASTYVKALAYLPPTAPFAMPVLVAVHAVTWWEFTLSAVISIGCTFGMARLAGTVYRRAVLRTGRRVPLRDVLTIRARTRSH